MLDPNPQSSDLEDFDDTTWAPNPGPQESFLSLPYEIQEGFFGGAAGGGKSWVLVMLPVFCRTLDGTLPLYKHPKFAGIIFRKTLPEIEEFLWPLAKRYYKKLGASFNNTKHLVEFPSGATMRFSYMDSKDDAKSHDGSSYNYIGWDELTHYEEWYYRYLFRSLRSSTKGLPTIVRSTSNPGNIGHNWVRARFVEPAREGYKKIWDPKMQTYRIFIPSKIIDNPKLLEASPNYINILQALPDEAERKAKIEGDWWAFAGQVFVDFRERHIDGEPENALHVIPAFEIPSFWPKIISCDWGYSHKTANYAHAISPDGRVFTYWEQVVKEVKIADWATDLGRFIRTQENVVLAVIDPSSKQNRGDEKNIHQLVEEYAQFRFEFADNDRIGGKNNMADMLRWKPRPKRYVPKEGFNKETADRIMRMYNIEAYNEYVKMFTEEPPETNIPRWQIFENCKELINTIPLCVHDEKKVEDVAKFTGDDPYDSARYGLKAVDRYVKECEQEFKRVQRLSKVLDELKATGDQTSFYRKMEKIEQDGEGGKGFNLFTVRRGAKRPIRRAFGN